MTATLNTLKGQLKLDPKLSAIANNGNKKGNNKGRQEKIKKSMFHQHEQKKNDMWKKELPKDGKAKEK